MKEEVLFSNLEVVQSVYNDMERVFSWYKKYYVQNDTTRQIYDHRDIQPYSYLLIDLESINEPGAEEKFKTELENFQKAFDTLDPKTKRPYPENIKPYLKRLYTETDGGMRFDIDWNSKKEMTKFLRQMVLLQTIGTMAVNFPKEYFEVFSDPAERAKIDAGIITAMGLYNRASLTLKKAGIYMQALNTLTLITAETTHQTEFSEYFNSLAGPALLKGEDIVIDATVDPIMEDYFCGKTIKAEQFDDITDQMEPYTNENAGNDIWNGIEGIVKNAHTEWMTVNKCGGVETMDHFLINGKTLRELVIESGRPQILTYSTASEFLRKALTDGKSRVELVKFSHDASGEIKLDYIPIKLDIDKLPINGKRVTNAMRDENLNSPESLQQQKEQHLRFENKYLTKFMYRKRDETLFAKAIPEFKFRNSEVIREYEKRLDALKAIPSASDRELVNMMISARGNTDRQENYDFDTVSYLEEGKLNTAELAKNIDFIVNFTTAKDGRSAAQMAQIIRSAQMAAYCYTIVHPTPDNEADIVYHKELVQMMQRPDKAFAAIMSKELKKELSKLPSIDTAVKDLMNAGKEKMNEARTRARAGENNYQKRVNEINERLAKIKGEVFDANNEAKEKQLFEEQKMLEDGLVQLRDAEIARLEQEYANGRLPKDYFEQRRVDVEQGKHERKLPFGVDERPSFKQFKIDNAIALDGMSSSDVKFAYDNMMESARREETKFILNAMGAQKHIETFAEQMEQISADSLKIPLSITEAKEGLDGPTSPAVTYSDPVADKTLTNN